jgi:tetratricopeptide (TPR) repeat protein
MIHIVRKQFKVWDRASQLAFVIAIVLLVILFVIVTQLPVESRGGALAAFGGVFLVLELVILWANRGMVTAYTRAQRQFLAGDFEAARVELEGVRATGKADFKALTLLGNTYRQLGAVDQSAMILREALQLAPDQHFPLYGFGRTLLVSGAYAEAAETIRSALDRGAPPVVQAELGEALYRQGGEDQAKSALDQASQLPAVANDPPRRLMVHYLRYRLGQAEIPPIALVGEGFAYWQATAERFRHTPYGADLALDLLEFERIIRGHE